MEKKFTKVEETVQEKRSQTGTAESDETSGDEDDVDDLFNWRTKS